MTEPTRDRYVVSPPWFFRLVAVFALGAPTLAVIWHPHDAVARLVLLSGLLVSVLTAVLLRLGLLRLRLAVLRPDRPC